MIRTRLALWNGVILALVLAGLGTVLFLMVRTVRYDTVDADLKGQVGFLRSMWTTAREHQLNPMPPPRMPAFDFGGDSKLAKHIALEIELGHPMLFSPKGRNLVNPADHPWDSAGLLDAAKGAEMLNSVEVEGLKVRVLSVPIFAQGR